MDTVTPEIRSRIMSQVRSKGNRSTELCMIRLLRDSRITGWKRNFALYGKPDFVFPRERVAVFVDGCFWHGCPRHCRLPSTRRRYWIAKVERNVARDKKTSRVLKRKGWIVVRFWEHDLHAKNAARKTQRLKRVVQQQSKGQPFD